MDPLFYHESRLGNQKSYDSLLLELESDQAFSFSSLWLRLSLPRCGSPLYGTSEKGYLSKPAKPSSCRKNDESLEYRQVYEPIDSN